MKKTVSIILCAVLIFAAANIGVFAEDAKEHEDFSLSALEFTRQMSAGWNLGNTFEATGRWGESWKDSYTPIDVETGWGNPKTTRRIFDRYAKKGFNAVRIPVSWIHWIDDKNDYNIDARWVERLKTVIGYAYENEMYVILNIHHDDKDWLDISRKGTAFEKVKTKFSRVWTHIANEFGEYDEHLVFEGLNEPIGGNDWWGNQPYYFENLNALYKVFVDAVRATGGNNKLRYLMVPTYGAQSSTQQTGNVILPNDDRMIVDIHWYDEGASVSNYESKFIDFERKFLAKGVPVVMGEVGIQKSRTDNWKYLWAKTYYGTAKKYGIPMFIWDDGGDYQVFHRQSSYWISEILVDEINAVTHGEDARTHKKNVFCDWMYEGTQRTEGFTDKAVDRQIYPDHSTDGVMLQAKDFVGERFYGTWRVDTIEANKVLSLLKKYGGHLEMYVAFEGAVNTDGGKVDKMYFMHNIGVQTPAPGIELPLGRMVRIEIDPKMFPSSPVSITTIFSTPGESITKAAVSIFNIIAVSDSLFGDVNDDDSVNAKDVLLLRKFVAKQPVSINEPLADVDLDEKLTAKDVLLIRKKLAKIYVTLGF